MRSSTFTLCMLLSACAVGGGGDTTPEDSGVTVDSSTPKDSSPQDTGFQQDSGAKDAPAQDTSTGNCAFSGVLATYDFSGELGSQVSTSAKSSASTVTAGAISRSSTVNATAGADSINSSGWATATTVNKNKYYTFTITPNAACALDITKISIATKSSSTGPTMIGLATSEDTFTAVTALTPNSTSTPSLSITGATSAVEVRVYGWSASATTGTMRVETTLTVSGATK